MWQNYSPPAVTRTNQEVEEEQEEEEEWRILSPLNETGAIASPVTQQLAPSGKVPEDVHSDGPHAALGPPAIPEPCTPPAPPRHK